MKEDHILYLSRDDVEKVNISMEEIIDSLEEMFIEKGNNRTEMPPKPGLHTKKDSFIHAMPAYIPKLKSAGLKLVSGYPENYKFNLPYISGLLVLNNTETGVPYAVMDCTWLTAMRTGAATALAAKYLARSNSEDVGIIGCGVQGRSNLEALSCIYDIKKVKAYDINTDAMEIFKNDMEKKLEIPIESVSDVKKAVAKMDIVVTSGPILKNPEPLIENGWFEEGSFASPVDFDSYWKGEVLKDVDKITTDDIEQFDYYKEHGYFKETPQPFAELGEIIIGKKKGREKEEERIISINLGIALEDIAVAPMIYRRALELEIGIELPL